MKAKKTNSKGKKERKKLQPLFKLVNERSKILSCMPCSGGGWPPGPMPPNDCACTFCSISPNR